MVLRNVSHAIQKLTYFINRMFKMGKITYRTVCVTKFTWDFVLLLVLEKSL